MDDLLKQGFGRRVTKTKRAKVKKVIDPSSLPSCGVHDDLYVKKKTQYSYNAAASDTTATSAVPVDAALDSILDDPIPDLLPYPSNSGIIPCPSVTTPNKTVAATAMNEAGTELLCSVGPSLVRYVLDRCTDQFHLRGGALYTIEAESPAHTLLWYGETVIAAPSGRQLFAYSADLGITDGSRPRPLRESMIGNDRVWGQASTTGHTATCTRAVRVTGGGAGPGLASSGLDGTVRLWDVATLQQTNVWAGLVKAGMGGGEAGNVRSKGVRALTSTGSTLVFARPAALMEWDWRAGGRAAGRLNDARVTDVAAHPSPSARTLLARTEEAAVIYDTRRASEPLATHPLPDLPRPAYRADGLPHVTSCGPHHYACLTSTGVALIGQDGGAVAEWGVAGAGRPVSLSYHEGTGNLLVGRDDGTIVALYPDGPGVGRAFRLHGKKAEDRSKYVRISAHAVVHDTEAEKRQFAGAPTEDEEAHDPRQHVVAGPSSTRVTKDRWVDRG